MFPWIESLYNFPIKISLPLKTPQQCVWQTLRIIYKRLKSIYRRVTQDRMACKQSKYGGRMWLVSHATESHWLPARLIKRDKDERFRLVARMWGALKFMIWDQIRGQILVMIPQIRLWGWNKWMFKTLRITIPGMGPLSQQSGSSGMEFNVLLLVLCRVLDGDSI